MGSDEQSTIVRKALSDSKRLFGQHLEVLRGQEIGRFNRLLHGVAHHDEAVVGHGFRSRSLGPQILKLGGELLLDLGHESLVRGHQHRNRHHVVLGLRQKIGRNDRGIRRLVGEHEQLTGTSEHVNRAFARYQLLGSGDPLVARTHDRVARRDATRSVREGGDGLGSADAQEEVGPSDMRGRLRDLCWSGRGHPHLADAGAARRNAGHQDGGWKGEASAWGVAASTFDRRNLLPRKTPRNGRLEVADARTLGKGEALDPCRGADEDLLLLLRNPVEGGLELFFRQNVWLALLQVAEPNSVVDQCLLPAFLDAFHDHAGLRTHVWVDDITGFG
mmetsp:Transcript_8064/g.15782  ORF Transcript_8064/g.15782 Transcript_8064/m.15782 type:complete len:332 (-) Transcript_8064:98-1093(-)